MTALQTTGDSTDTVPRDHGVVPHIEDVPTIVPEAFIDSPHDPQRSTTAWSVDFWRRVGTPAPPGGGTLDQPSSLDVWRHRRQLPLVLLRVPRPEASSAATSVEPPVAADLHAALHDLDGAASEAQEEGFPQPSHDALRNAKRLLRDLYRLRPCRLEAYPTPDGEIALVAPGGYGRSVLVLCDSDGGVLCSVNLHGCHRRARYTSATTLPDGFIREALKDLDDQNRA